MKQGIFTIIDNKKLTESVYKMTLRGDTAEITKPGQFVNIKLDGLFLRRPISVCDCEGDTLTVLYKVVGVGTEKMASLHSGDTLDILTGLGNGYDTTLSGVSPLLIGGGVGVPPMYMLAKRLLSEGKKVSVILGFNDKSEVFYEEEFKVLGASVTVTTVNGTYGKRGFVTDAMAELEYTHFYTCGPEAMFRAIEKVAKTSGQFSFEERMGCGFGACMGCTCETKYGAKRICRDGPVLMREEIVW